VCDIVINVLLTLVFIYLLSPLARGSQPAGGGFTSQLAWAVGNVCRRTRRKDDVHLHPANQRLVRKVERLLWKTLLGCVLVVLPASGNLTALSIFEGKMPAFVSRVV
jgi:hypothetical protein